MHSIASKRRSASLPGLNRWESISAAQVTEQLAWRPKRIGQSSWIWCGDWRATGLELNEEHDRSLVLLVSVRTGARLCSTKSFETACQKHKCIDSNMSLGTFSKFIIYIRFLHSFLKNSLLYISSFYNNIFYISFSIREYIYKRHILFLFFVRTYLSYSQMYIFFFVKSVVLNIE